MATSPGNVTTHDPAAISWSAPGPSSHNNMAVQGFGVGDGTGCGPGQSCSVHATAGLTFSISAAWQGSSPPLPVILRETSVASFTGSNQANATNFGSASDGINDPQVATATGGVSQTSSSGTPAHYSAQSGSSWHIDRTLSADGTQSVTAPPDNGAGAGMSVGVGAYSLDIYPIVLNPGGAALDSANNYNILVGQGCTASLSGLPTFPDGYTVSYQWTVSGNTFQDWEPTTPEIVRVQHANPYRSYYVPGPGKLTNSTAHWYWNEAQQTPETVTCTITVTPPAGQGAAFNVTMTQKVTVQVPQWTADGTGGYMQVNTNAPNQNGAMCLYAGPPAGQSGGGMNWTATSSPPPSSTFGMGTLELVQLVTPSASYVNSTGVAVPGTTHPCPQNGQSGLDGQCPYPWVTVQTGFAGGFSPYTTNDSPTLPLDDSIASATMTHGFTDYLLYQPPGNDVRWVPRGTFTWSTNGNATNPGSWANYATVHGSDSAGDVNPAATTPFTPGKTFPSWTQIIVLSPLPWPSS